MTTTADVRRQNTAAVLRAVLDGCSNRSEIALRCALSGATVSRIVEGLVANQVLTEGDQTPVPTATRVSGRPVVPIALAAGPARFLLVELGPRLTRLATSPYDISKATEWLIEFETPRTAKLWKKMYLAACDELRLSEFPKIVVVSVPGVVDEARSRAILSPNLHWSEGFAFDQLHADQPEVRVHLMQEIRALAIGRASLAPSTSSFLLVDFGTGVGSAAVMSGSLLQGPLATVGEIGHTPVPGNPLLCGCGSTGCLETLMSRTAILSRFGVVSMSELSKALGRRSPPRWLTERLDEAATVIVAAVNMLGVSDVILTGYFSELPRQVVMYLQQAIQRGAIWSRFGETRVEVASRNRLGGLANNAFNRFLESL